LVAQWTFLGAKPSTAKLAVKKPAASSSDSSSDDDNVKSAAKTIPAQIKPKSAAISKPVPVQKTNSSASDSSSEEEATPKGVPVQKSIGVLFFVSVLVIHH